MSLEIDESGGLDMSFEGRKTGLDYYPCRYGASRTVFRGPRVSLDRPYTVVVGGSEIYGKYVEDPLTDQLAERTGRRVVNLGVMNGGVDAFVLDDDLMRVITGAEAVVVQAMGAQNMSNRYYTVHPRRNDRFLRQSALMNSLYREVDFSDFTFTRHMLITLQKTCPERFVILREELSVAWVARMRLLLSRVPGRRIMLWIEDGTDRGLGSEPPFVTVDMLQELEGLIDKVVHCDISDLTGETHLDRMIFPETERAVALHAMTPAAHDHVAEALAKMVRKSGGLAA
ncbi:DUF6473 family protein [Jannaschia rubra]|nr:DUF6473 family protein [Jannaschia rubra]